MAAAHQIEMTAAQPASFGDIAGMVILKVNL
jgi:hypothetical protein